MNNRPLQPGDLCLILSDESDFHGKFPTTQCTLERFVDSGVRVIISGGLKCRTTQPTWFVQLATGQLAYIGQQYLMRIDGNPDAEQDSIHEEEPEECNA